MTDTELPGLELRKAVAEKIGWAQVMIEGEPGHEEMYGVYPGCDYAVGLIPSYELSLDACIRDVVPWARDRGCSFSLRNGHDWAIMNKWEACFWNPPKSAVWGQGETGAEALCRAVVKVEV